MSSDVHLYLAVNSGGRLHSCRVQEVLCGSHRLYLVLESIRMTSLLEYLANNEDNSMSVGQCATDTASERRNDLRFFGS